MGRGSFEGEKMHNLIRDAAACNYVDAAHYTWILIDTATLDGHSEDALLKRLEQHGDYATPLNTKQVKQPFENMAVVIKLDAIGRFMVATIDCANSCVDTVIFWTDDVRGPKDRKALVMRFNVSEKEWIEKQKDAQLQHLYPNPEKVPEERRTVVEVTEELSKKEQEDLINYCVPTARLLLRYIPAASEGLLSDPPLVYYRATSNASNAKRIRKGKAPLYEWRTVELQRKPAELPSAPNGGTHASPRLHQRRGHWATSKLGKKFWRREAVVGNPENGMIFHDYKDGEAHA